MEKGKISIFLKDTLSTINGCDSIIISIVNVLQLPNVNAGNDLVLTVSSPIQLNATGANIYYWSTGDSTSSIQVFPESYNIIY